MVSLLPTKTLTIDGDTRLGQSGVPALLWLPVVQGLLPSNFHSVMMGRGSTQEPPSRFLHFAALLSQSVNLGTIWLSWKGKVSFPVHSTLHWLWRWQLSLFFWSFQWPTPIKLKGLFLHWIERTTHTGTTTRCRTQRSQPHPPHTRGTFHRRLRPLYTEKRKVSCPGFLPRTKPMQHSCSHYNAFRSITSQTCTYLRTWRHQRTTIYNNHAAIAASRRKPARIYARGNTRWQQSCSHFNAICHHRFKKRKELRTQEQPLAAEHRGGTKTTPAAPAAHTRYLSSPAAATLQGKTQGFVLRLPPENKAPCNVHAAITMHFAASRRKPARIYTPPFTERIVMWWDLTSHKNTVNEGWCETWHHIYKNTLNERWCETWHHITIHSMKGGVRLDIT